MAAGAVRIALDTWVVPRWVPAAGGQLTLLNSLVLTGSEPVLVDTGPSLADGLPSTGARLSVGRLPSAEALSLDGGDEAAWSVVDPGDVRWVVLTSDHSCHAGALMEVLAACPLALVVAAPAVAARLLAAHPGLTGRVRPAAPGRPLPVHGRALLPIEAGPDVLGLADPQAGLLWAADAFAAPVPARVLDPAELPEWDWAGALREYAAASPCHAGSGAAQAAALAAGWPGPKAPELVVPAHGPLLRGRLVAEAAAVHGAPFAAPVLRAAGP
ncbi:MBL fold metallo-hydrolase [Motilibacter deserti]|uniref:Metallo-beta-lactamase superfamily protein n=1 Tax=Motilibacter deserti TaxID=2714956 RepID=A0ABX0GZZ5_9ACTN|nr:hypothetical protein [Motilibacter deserti]NHC15681.1 hypothetical protein [Motilibacter deserti]